MVPGQDQLLAQSNQYFKNMETIKVLLDTNIIENNTADSVAVEITKKEPISTDTYQVGNNTINLIERTVSKPSNTYLGSLKSRLPEIDQEILFHKNRILELNEEKPLIQEKITIIQPVIETAINEAILNGAVDNRT